VKPVRSDAPRRVWTRARVGGVVVATVAVLGITSAEAVLPPAAAAAAARPAVDPRSVPVLPTAPASTPAARPAPKADFTPMAKAGESHFDPKRSKIISRSTYTEEYLNPDGTHSVRQSTKPLNIELADGTWTPVNTALTVDNASKRATAARNPLTPSMAGNATDPAVLRVVADGHAVSLGLDRAAPAAAKVAGDGVSYADVAPSTDLGYEVTSGQVKETIKLKKPPATSSWRFRLDAGDLTPAVDPSGEVRLTDAHGEAKLVIPPVETWDSAGGGDKAPAVTGGAYGLERAGSAWWLTVSVDEKWLHDAKRVYPVTVDPTFAFGVGESHAYRSDGYTCANCGLRIGNSLNGGDTYNRSWFYIDYSSLWGKTVVGAKLDVDRQSDTTGSIKTWSSGLWHATDRNFNALGEYLGSALVGDVGSFTNPNLTNYLRGRVDARDNNVAFILTGGEDPGVWSYKHLNATLTVDTGTAPPAPTLASPADGSVLTSLTPTLAVNPVSDSDGDKVKYCFRVATGADAESGVVVDSGCLDSPTWTVPSGVLQDGVAYTWHAAAYSGITKVTPSWIGHLKVDQRIGDHGPSPVDNYGGATVNLANGNLSVAEATPSFATVGGSAGLTFTYNSQQVDPKGLRASYFNDLSHNGIINPSQQPVLVRTEPQVNVDWAANSPFPPALTPDYFVVRWEGYFQAPATGTYQFAGVHDDAAQIWVNNNQVYTTSSGSDLNWAAATGVSLTAGQRVPIKVELQEITGNAMMRLFARTSDGTTVPAQIVPADWLYSNDVPALPPGWTLSADLDGSGVTYTTAQVTDQNVVLTDSTGAKHTWTKKSTGGYTAPAGEDGLLTLDTNGLVVLTEGTEVFSFRADGKLGAQTASADSRKPAALQNIYDGGTPSRLVQIKDPVGGRAQVLHYNRAGDDCYGGATPPQGADATPPAQMLCRVSYWDGTETRLWYTGGRLSRIEDPGSEVSDYGYNTTGQLSIMRQPLVNDWIAADPTHRRGPDYLTDIAYDTATGKAKATSITGPAPKLGAARAARGYRYDPANRQTFMDVTGLSPATGFAGKVTYDDADRALTSTDATGKVNAQTWSPKDQALTSTDAAGRVSTTVYDRADRETDTYGPAPASCFNGQLPTTCQWGVPHTHTDYDQGLNGLAVAWYDNDSLTGAPKVFTTGIGVADGSLVRNWGTAAPTTGIPADHYSLRATGEITFPQAGDYTLRLLADDGIRVWVDDQIVVDDWRNTSAWRTATVHSDAANSVKRIRVEYYDFDQGAQLEMDWTTPSGVQQAVPGTQLSPRYDLPTGSVESDDRGVPEHRTATSYGDGNVEAMYGLATKTAVDPAGLNLGGVDGYEPLGSGYLRRTSKTMPTGAKTTYAYYGDTETRANPCVAGSAAVNQGGMAKLTTSATPATGGARTDEQVYDASGRVVAKATSGDWICTSYDARGRTAQQTFPANPTVGARTVTYNYAVNGDPLTSSVSDYTGTVTTTVDLLGRTVSYTDANGVKTDTGYDAAGRPSTSTVTPPNSADQPQVTTLTYDDAGRVLTTQLGSTVLATSHYDNAGELSSVDYANGAKLAAVNKNGAGETTSLQWHTSDGKDVVSAVTRSTAGTIVDEALNYVDPRPDGANYSYDTAGRLTEAYVTGHHYTYDFTSTASSACPTGTQANAGLNTNRMRLLDQTGSGTAETDYCYDAADRLLATVGANAMTGFTYDSHGNTTQFVSGGATTFLGYDSADRHLTASTKSSDPNQVADVSYVRDTTNRIVRRDARSGDSNGVALYGYSGDGDSADLTMDGTKKVLSTSIGLPGGVLYTVQGGSNTWDAPSVRGDLVLTLDSAGKQSGDLRYYTPFGEALSTSGAVDPQAVPDNQPGKMDYGWLGQNQRPYEHAGALALVEMGARPYLPGVGRFLSVDPVEGGSANDYDYVNANPINATDLDGTRSRYRHTRRHYVRHRVVHRRVVHRARHRVVHRVVHHYGGGGGGASGGGGCYYAMGAGTCGDGGGGGANYCGGGGAYPVGCPSNNGRWGNVRWGDFGQEAWACISGGAFSAPSALAEKGITKVLKAIGLVVKNFSVWGAFIGCEYGMFTSGPR
jgi:RHS repeat-associated protein